MEGGPLHTGQRSSFGCIKGDQFSLFPTADCSGHLHCMVPLVHYYGTACNVLLSVYIYIYKYTYMLHACMYICVCVCVFFHGKCMQRLNDVDAFVFLKLFETPIGSPLTQGCDHGQSSSADRGQGTLVPRSSKACCIPW